MPVFRVTEVTYGHDGAEFVTGNRLVRAQNVIRAITSLTPLSAELARDGKRTDGSVMIDADMAYGDGYYKAEPVTKAAAETDIKLLREQIRLLQSVLSE